MYPGSCQPCTTTSRPDADAHYSVGPVYLAALEDWRLIADRWWRAMPHVLGRVELNWFDDTSI